MSRPVSTTYLGSFSPRNDLLRPDLSLNYFTLILFKLFLNFQDFLKNLVFRFHRANRLENVKNPTISEFDEIRLGN